MSFYSDEERTRCTESGCRNAGIPPDYNICMDHYEKLMATEKIETPKDVHNTEYDAYRNLLNIVHEIQLEHIQLIEDVYRANEVRSLTEWFSVIIDEISRLSRELNNLPSIDNNIIEIRSELIKLAAIIVTWLASFNNSNSQSNDENPEEQDKKEEIIYPFSSFKMCTDCISYMFAMPKVFCNNLEHIRYPRD